MAGSDKYHGALLYAVNTVSRLVDLIYVHSSARNLELINNLKQESASFITIDQSELDQSASSVDCILVGPGLGVGERQRCLVSDLLSNYPERKFVLDADALKVIDPDWLGSNCLVTPHAGEFEQLFDLKPTPDNVLAMAGKYGCVVVLKGQTDYVSDGSDLYANQTGNAGLTKGGTGDVLAGLIAGLACTNELLLAAQTGVFVLGLAGDQLFERVGFNYSAEDVVERLPKTLGVGARG